MNTPSGGIFSMGPQTYPVSIQDLFVSNRKKLGTALNPELTSDDTASTTTATNFVVVFVQGGISTTRYDSDHEPLFRQESYFWWLTGVKEPDCAVSIRYLFNNDNANTTSNNNNNNDEDGVLVHTTLYVPRLDADYATVMGKIRSLEEWKDLYLVDRVLYTDEIETNLCSELHEEKQSSDGIVPNGIDNTHNHSSATSAMSTKLLLLQGPNSDSGLMYEPPPSVCQNPKFKSYVDCTMLFPVLAECRVMKSSAELHLLQHITEVTSHAHAYVMRNFQPGLWEYQGESLFRHYCYYNYGARYMGYTPICGCGPDAAILHYGHAGEPNARQSTAVDICLFDMGAEYAGYGSDVTCSFPASGTFTSRQKMIYQAVYNAQVAVYNMMKPGVSWVDCHLMAEKTILTALYEAGLVVIPNDDDDNAATATTTTTIDDLVQMRLGAVFMPHGLGHFIGIDTHDVGGYLPGHPDRSALPGLKKLRTARILQCNMVLTVEPGCYFIDHLLDNAMAEDSPLRPYLHAPTVNSYRGFGGVRLEDVVQVTESGIVNYTVCPRTIHEVESVMAGTKWPPMVDEAPDLRRTRLTATSPLPPPPSR